MVLTMTSQTSRRIRYNAAPPLVQRPRIEPLPVPTIDWDNVRKWLPPTLLLVSVIVLYLVQSSFATTSQLEIARLMKERDTLMRQNLQLQAEIAESEKPSRIRERAYALGFVDTSRSIRLSVPATTEPLVPTTSVAASDPFVAWQRTLFEFARWLSRPNR